MGRIRSGLGQAAYRLGCPVMPTGPVVAKVSRRRPPGRQGAPWPRFDCHHGEVPAHAAGRRRLHAGRVHRDPRAGRGQQAAQSPYPLKTMVTGLELSVKLRRCLMVNTSFGSSGSLESRTATTHEVLRCLAHAQSAAQPGVSQYAAPNRAAGWEGSHRAARPVLGSGPSFSDAFGDCEPSGPDGCDELLVVVLVLAGVAFGEVGDRFVERVAVAEVFGDGDRVS